MLYTCPKCHKPFDLDPKVVNETHSFSCPHCEAFFEFASPAKEAPEVNPEPISVPDPFAAEIPQVADVPAFGTKLCPFCGEVIQSTAIKCRFCGEILNAGNPLYATLNVIEDAPAPAAPIPPKKAKSYKKVWNGWKTAYIVLSLQALFFLFVVYLLLPMTTAYLGMDGDYYITDAWDIICLPSYDFFYFILIVLYPVFLIGLLLLFHTRRNKISNGTWTFWKYCFIVIFVFSCLLFYEWNFLFNLRSPNIFTLLLPFGFALVSSSLFLFKGVKEDK